MSIQPKRLFAYPATAPRSINCESVIVKFRLLVLVPAMLMLSFVLPQQGAGAQQCTLSASPGGGAPVGALMDLSGSGWSPGETVFVNLGGMQIAQITADAGGVVSAAATVPDLPLGGQLLFAFNNSASCESSSTYQVIDQLPPPPPLVCTITASPSAGASTGTPVAISGNGWAANDTVFVNLGGVQIGTFSADGLGSFSGSSTVPNLSVGDQLLFAFNTTTTCETSGTFAVLSQPAPTTTAPAVTTTSSPPTTTDQATTTTEPVSTTTLDTSTTQPATTTTVSDQSAADSAEADDGSSSGFPAWILLIAGSAAVLGAGFLLGTRRRSGEPSQD